VKPIVIWGAAGQARVLAEFLGTLDYEIVAMVDTDPAVTPFLSGVPLLRSNEELRSWRTAHSGEMAALVAIGGARGSVRLAVQRALLDDGYRIPVVVHPRAFVAGDAVLGDGTQVLALAAVCASARLGAACIVNTGATIDHECLLGDAVHVGPGAHLAGNVTVGDRAFIGTGASVIPDIKIGAGATIGAGAVVVTSVPPNALAYGNPARVRSELV
jgi:sugar O-acyltransferase (sialic acid O-acetyltransferase NeuD family)